MIFLLRTLTSELKTETIDLYSSPTISVIYRTYDTIQNKSISRPHTTNMLDTNVTVDDNQ